MSGRYIVSSVGDQVGPEHPTFEEGVTALDDAHRKGWRYLQLSNLDYVDEGNNTGLTEDEREILECGR